MRKMRNFCERISQRIFGNDLLTHLYWIYITLVFDFSFKKVKNSHQVLAQELATFGSLWSLVIYVFMLLCHNFCARKRIHQFIKIKERRQHSFHCFILEHFKRNQKARKWKMATCQNGVFLQIPKKFPFHYSLCYTAVRIQSGTYFHNQFGTSAWENLGTSVMEWWRFWALVTCCTTGKAGFF